MGMEGTRFSMPQLNYIAGYNRRVEVIGKKGPKDQLYNNKRI